MIVVRSRWTLALGAPLAALTVGAALARFDVAPKSRRREAPIALTSAAFRLRQGTNEGAPTIVGVDTFTTVPGDASQLDAATEGARFIAATAPRSDGRALADAVRLWGRFDAPRVRVWAPPDSDLAAYATSSPEGSTLCVRNCGPDPIDATIRMRVRAGVYRVERLTFDTTTSPDRPVQTQLASLAGHDLGATGVISERASLQPDETCLLRCSDEAEEVNLARRAARQQLTAAATGNPGPVRQIRRILAEAEPYQADLHASIGRIGSSSKRLNRIHHLLLLIAEAELLQRNFQERRDVGAERGAAVMGALERWQDALSETSAALIGLSPRLTIEPVASGATLARVTLSVANNGATTVPMLKLGLDADALPPGATCAPGDPTIFGALRPGQTARAVYEITGPRDTSLPNDLLVGDVSYFPSGAPAHLRVRGW